MENLNTIKQKNVESKQTTQDKYEVLKGFAHKVEANYARYERMTAPIVQEAVEKGIVIVYAEDEERVLFLGAKMQEVASTMLNSCEQVIKLDFDGTALDDSEEEYSAQLRCYRYSFGWSWLFKLENVQYEIFNDRTDGVNFCQGIVFYLEDLADKKIIDVNCKNEYGFVDDKNNFRRETVKFIKNRTNNREVELALDCQTKCPFVVAGNKIFVLDWIDILGLAIKAGLFDEKNTQEGETNDKK